MILKPLAGATVNNKWCYALKRAIKYDSIIYSIGLVANNHKNDQEFIKAWGKPRRLAVYPM